MMDVIARAAGLGQRAAYPHPHIVDKRTEHQVWRREYREDMPEGREWVWRS